MSAPTESRGSSTARASADGTATSKSLLARVRARDPEAWGRLVALYAPLVYHYCRRARLPAEDAADVSQEVFQASFARIESFEKRRASDSFRAWLATIARNKVRDHFRHLARHPKGGGGTELQVRMNEALDPGGRGDGHGPGDGAREDELAQARVLRSALDNIRGDFHERTWLAFLGTALDGRPPKDVGEELGMKPGAVRVAKSRVLQRLRAELGDLET